MAPVVNTLAAENAVHSVVRVTAQHRQVLDQVLQLFSIRPDHDLDLMVAGQTLNELTSRTIAALDAVIAAEKPDRILVHGDTTTAMVATIAALHHRVPIGHVEAGLRTRDLGQPWPEEFNRRVVDVAANLLFAPTRMARENLESECLPGRIVVTGNTVIDALQETVRRLDAEGERGRFSRTINPYGNGHAAHRIVACLLGRPFDEFEPDLRVPDLPKSRVPQPAMPNGRLV